MVDRNANNCIRYTPPPGISDEDWCFIRDFDFKFHARVFTKGCYFYENSTDLIANRHDVPNITAAMIVFLLSIHMVIVIVFGLNQQVMDFDRVSTLRNFICAGAPLA
ncbi:hypothetical protein GCK32_015400 [Trichostrongylus colubriformis]|uniref:Uncharacterized protein n=1 Tax=Trichostrongylus colubriformis TaxID=6319 RepID=A0AAN8FUG0_TRICO